MMKKKFKFLVAVIVFVVLVIVGNWPGATGTKDRWDDLVRWAKK